MKALKNLLIGSSASVLTEKQMKALIGGTTYYCICYNESEAITATSCQECVFKCENGGGLQNCNYVEGY